MKKIVFIIMMLLIPFVVSARIQEGDITFYFDDGSEQPIYYDFTVPVERIGFIDRDSDSRYQYSKSYEYEDGLYHLTGVIKYDNFDWLIRYDNDFKNAKILYTCVSETETSCEKLRVVFTDYRTSINSRATTLRIENGEDVEDIRYYKVADSYEKVGDIYKLIDPEDYDIVTILRTGRDLEGRYICSDRVSTECKELYYILYGTATQLIVNSTKDKFVYGKSYEFEDGKYKLKEVNEEDWWPNYRDVQGYSCLTDSIECTDMVLITGYVRTEVALSYEFLELYGAGHFNMINLTYNTETIEVPVGGVVLGASYFTNVELVNILDRSVLELEGDQFIPLKVGETFLIGMDNDGNTKVLHVFVTQEMLDAYHGINPKTKTGLMLLFVFVFTILLLIAFTIKKNKYN